MPIILLGVALLSNSVWILSYVQPILWYISELSSSLATELVCNSVRQHWQRGPSPENFQISYFTFGWNTNSVSISSYIQPIVWYKSELSSHHFCLLSLQKGQRHLICSRFSTDSSKMDPTKIKNHCYLFFFIDSRLRTYLWNYWSHRNSWNLTKNTTEVFWKWSRQFLLSGNHWKN